MNGISQPAEIRRVFAAELVDVIDDKLLQKSIKSRSLCILQDVNVYP